MQKNHLNVKGENSIFPDQFQARHWCDNKRVIIKSNPENEKRK